MQQKRVSTEALPSGIIIAALRGGAGKTVITLGITSALKRSGISIAPFKKGPDYIDAGWLALAAGQPCYNLDLFLCSPDKVVQSYHVHSSQKEIAIVEGNRGLYDGIDVSGSTSTAELAKLLDLPVVLCIDSTKTTRTMAAAVSGCVNFDPDVKIKGIILNRVAGPRHEAILRKCIEHYCGIPVLGALPKLTQQDFPERHMGLIPTAEHSWANESIEAAGRIAEKYLDLEAIVALTRRKSLHVPIKNSLASDQTAQKSASHQCVRIGIFKDAAFQFYYPDNIEALEAEGAEVIFSSPLTSDVLPNVDALYIGGGFPETHARQLAENKHFRETVKALADQGLPIYAECGGLIYLGEELIMDDKSYPMTGVLPIVFGLSKRPQGHGYTISIVEHENPFFEEQTELRGHEFRYSKVLTWAGNDQDMVFRTQRGKGFVNHRDGICYKNVLASYTHLHALGVPDWARAMVRNAQIFRSAINSS